jgi:hypothetical protein
MSLGVAFFRARAPDSGAAKAQFMEIAILAASIAAAASAGMYFFISCSPVTSPPKWKNRSGSGFAGAATSARNPRQHCGEI